MASSTMSSAIPWPVWVALAVISALLFRTIIHRKGRLRLPPGPRPLPFLGNALDLPHGSDVGRSWLAMAKKYGDIVYFNVLGQPALNINSLHHTLGLLDKKSANLSSRPGSVMLELLNLDKYFVFMPYGRKWREHRRAFHKTFGPESLAQWQTTQLKAAQRLLSRLLESPKDFVTHLNMAVTETIMRVAYGIELTGGEGDREYFRMVDRMIAIIEPLIGPGAHVVEVFPFLRWLPSWLPGMGFKRDSFEKRSDADAITAHLFALSKAATDKGVIKDSMVTRILANANTEDPHGPDVQAMCQYATGTAFIAGIEAPNSAMEAFFLAMAMHPEVQKRAQQELDAVVGPDRLPTFSDFGHLPYVGAIVKELERWHIIAPVGFPHSVTADDEYMGYHIPAGTIVNSNIWAMSRDENEYPDPESFMPERFLREGNKLPARDPAEYVFGSGRRICPGRHFATELLFIYCASILHVFDIRPPLDEFGAPVKLEYRTMGSMLSHVQGCEYDIVPRSGCMERLVGED